MISIPLEAGVHEIEMKFIPQGFLAGLLLTILAALLLAALTIFGDGIREALASVINRKKEQETAAASTDSDSTPPESDEL